MTKTSLRGIIAGILTFISLVGLLNTVFNYFGLTATSPITYSLHLLAWIIPGYVAGLIGHSNGVIHGSIVGIIIGVITGGLLAMLSLAFPQTSDWNTTLEIGMQTGIRATLLCGLGGLFWEIKKHLTSK